MSEEKPKVSFVTFYSFKGGVGRSMALINTAGNLAGRGFRVLVIDLDLEAPGLSYLNPKAPEPSPSTDQQKELFFQRGFVDLLSDAKNRGREGDLFVLSASDVVKSYTQAYHLPKELCEFPGGSLHIMPAGKFDADYAHRFDALNLRELYQDGLGEPLIRAFKKKITDADLYDYVLVDSRTGFSDEAGICTRDLADYLMILSGLNRQNIEGTCTFLRALRIAKAGLETKFTIILSPVPNGEDELLDEREKMAKESFESAWGAAIDVSLQIPYHPQLALTEEPHIFRRRRGYLFEAYRKIESSLLSALGHEAYKLQPIVESMLAEKNYFEALRTLRQIIRLDGGSSVITFLSGRIVEHRQLQIQAQKGEPQIADPLISSLLLDNEGIKVVEFIVDNLKFSANNWNWVTRNFLDALIKQSPNLAQRLVNRAQDPLPNDGNFLFGLAELLCQHSFDLDSADKYYEKAIELSSGRMKTHYTTHYAIYLERKRGQIQRAEALYSRMIAEAGTEAPMLAMHYCNYGQLLVGDSRLAEGEQALLNAFSYANVANPSDIAETSFVLWVAARMQNHPGDVWERVFKFALLMNFPRPVWDFGRVLKQAQANMEPEEFTYAKALGDAFLNQSNVPNLQQFVRWNNLEPLDPRAVKNNVAQ